MSEPLTDESYALLALPWSLVSDVPLVDHLAAIEAAAVRRAAQPGRSASDGVGVDVTKAVVDALMAEETGAGYYRWQYENIVRSAIRAAQPGRSASDGVGGVPTWLYEMVQSIHAAASLSLDDPDEWPHALRDIKGWCAEALAALATPPPAPDGEVEPCSPHEFGQHSDSCDPWDALLCDVKSLEGDDRWASSLVLFWRKAARALPPTPAAADRPEPHPCFCQHGYGCDSYGRPEPVSPDPTPAAAVSVSALGAGEGRLPDAEALARTFHEAYERMAPRFGYETRKDSAVPWEQVPSRNRDLMRATASVVLSWLEGWFLADIRLAAARDTGARGETEG